MPSQTRRALQDFDNQHDFERMAADVLNGLGYQDVEPMAPNGGSDGGKDIKFRSGESAGVAFVTLRKDIKRKFAADLERLGGGDGLIALFCNVDVPPAMRLSFTRDAVERGFTLQVFDLESIRSLLDSKFKDVRRRYLHIDDEVAARLRAEVKRLLAFPDAIPDEVQPPTHLESMLTNKMPRRLFDLLIKYDPRDIREVPDVGPALHSHLQDYHSFRRAVIAFENALLTRIHAEMHPDLRFPIACQIHLKYALLRFFGMSAEQITKGENFLNYGITWETAEKKFSTVSASPELGTAVQDLQSRISQLGHTCASLASY